jgi:hypothetical protein
VGSNDGGKKQDTRFKVETCDLFSNISTGHVEIIKDEMMLFDEAWRNWWDVGKVGRGKCELQLKVFSFESLRKIAKMHDLVGYS